MKRGHIYVEWPQYFGRIFVLLLLFIMGDSYTVAEVFEQTCVTVWSGHTDSHSYKNLLERQCLSAATRLCDAYCKHKLHKYS